MRRHFFLILTILTFFITIPTIASSASNPVVLYTDITSGPNTGGENNNGVYLSIFGKNFGSSLANVKVYVGGGEVAKYVYLGQSLGRPDVQQLSVQLGQAAKSGPVKVVVSGLTSNLDQTFTVRPGNLYFISHTGSDSTGVANNFSKPFRSAWYIWNLSAFKAGDFIIVMNDSLYDFGSGQEGLYTGYGNGAWLVLNKSGDSVNNPITIYGYPGATPVSFRFSDENQFLARSSAQAVHRHIVIANFKVDHNNHRANSLSLGFYASTTDSVEYPRIVNYWASNCLPNWSGSSGVTCLSLQNVDYLKMYGVQVGPQGTPNDSTNAGHVIYQSHRYTDADTGWIYIHDFTNSRAAYQLAGDAWASPRENSWSANTNVRIHDSLFRNLAQEAILLNLGSNEIFLYNNIIDNAVTKNNGFAAIALRGSQVNVGDYYLYNNTVYTDAIGHAIIEMGYLPQGTYPRSVTLYNNIVYAKSPVTLYSSFVHPSFTSAKVTSDNNIWYGSSQATLPYAGSNDRFVNPAMVSPQTGNFNLLFGGPAIARGIDDAGVNLLVKTDYDAVERLRGVGLDIGALQYKSSDTLRPQSPPKPSGTKK
jgi:hypothetical protein